MKEKSSVVKNTPVHVLTCIQKRAGTQSHASVYFLLSLTVLSDAPLEEIYVPNKENDAKKKNSVATKTSKRKTKKI